MLESYVQLLLGIEQGLDAETREEAYDQLHACMNTSREPNAATKNVFIRTRGR